MPNHFDFSRIKRFREDLNLTQEALAALISTREERVYVQQISEWENRTRGGVNTSTLAKLCKALRHPMEDFFTETTEPRA